MKKFVFISLILALVASVAFAQDEGSWSVGGAGEIGTIVNFRNRAADGGDHVRPLVGAHGYNRYGWYGGPFAQFNLKYNKGPLSVGFEFDIVDEARVDLSYNSDTAAFQGSIRVEDLVANNFAPGRLWGYYKFLDGKIHLETALNSRDTNYWFSNRVLGNVFKDPKTSGINGTGGFIAEDGYTKVDHHSYLVADFAPIEGLTVGLMIPGLFNWGGGDGGKWAKGDKLTTHQVGDDGIDGTPDDYDTVNPGYVGAYANSFNATSYELGSRFKLLRFGAKYATGPVDVSLQFALQGANSADKNKLDAGLYLGGKYNISDEINAGLAMEFDINADESNLNKFGIGFNFGYGSGPFNASLEGGIAIGASTYDSVNDKWVKDKGTFGLRPYLAYNLVENYLCLSLTSFVFMYLDSDVADVKGIGYEITPELWFNVAGTGAGAGYWYPNTTAIIVRYVVGGLTKSGKDTPAKDPTLNALDITFKWSF